MTEAERKEIEIRSIMKMAKGVVKKAEKKAPKKQAAKGAKK